jgi:hypothetical protein
MTKRLNALGANILIEDPEAAQRLADYLHVTVETIAPTSDCLTRVVLFLFTVLMTALFLGSLTFVTWLLTGTP